MMSLMFSVIYFKVDLMHKWTSASALYLLRFGLLSDPDEGLKEGQNVEYKVH